MKKSLTLDNQPQSFAKRFEKHKIIKTVKHQPSHFTESTKASKFENLEVLSEIFTIPQSALAQPSHVTANTGDDWSDFSGATETVFQEQTPPMGLDPSISGLSPATSGLVPPTSGLGPPTSGFHPPTLGQSLPVSQLSSIQNVPAKQMVATSGLVPGAVAFNWESGNEGGLGGLQEPIGGMGMFSQPVVSTAQLGTIWNTTGSDGMLVGVNKEQTGGIWNTTGVSNGSNGMSTNINVQWNAGQGMVTESEFGDFQSEVPGNGAAQDQGL